MVTHNEIIEVIRKNFPYLKDMYKVKRIGLFGSFVKGTQRENSDVDLLVEFEEPIGLHFVEMAEYIEKMLGRSIDILTPEGIRSIRIKEIADDIERSIIYA